MTRSQGLKAEAGIETSAGIVSEIMLLAGCRG